MANGTQMDDESINFDAPISVPGDINCPVKIVGNASAGN